MGLALLACAAAPTCSIVGGSDDKDDQVEVANAPAGAVAPYGILFVTQVPVAGFNVVTSAFGNHETDVEKVPRGGDLWVRYDDASLRNLTAEAGFGVEGLQGEKAIAVREPSVHWDGRKALFSMLVGAPAERYGDERGYRWQIYEVDGLAKGERARVTKVAKQPADFDNVAPFYGTDDRVLFTSSRPRTGEAHLYPQLDEYESAPTVVGLYSLDPTSGSLFLVNHATSGVFSPFVDSAGRIIYTKWDHLQRDQQEEADRLGGGKFGSFDWADESAGAAKGDARETFPEARDAGDPNLLADEAPHTFNQFFPWQINEDGSGEETLNHIGRHEFGGTYSDGSVPSDPNLTFNTPPSAHANRVYIDDDGGLFQLAEDPNQPGTFYATNAQEFGTEASGQIVRFTGGVGVNPDQMVITELTPTVTRSTPDGKGSSAHTGHYRDPLPLSGGRVLVSHTSEVRVNDDDGSVKSPRVRYAFRLKVLEERGGTFVAGSPLTAGIRKSISWWTPDEQATWEGELWELDAVEIRSRPRPTKRAEGLPAPERSILEAEGVNEAELRAWLSERSLALIVSRNVTSRDRADVQQPFNLQITGSETQSIGGKGRVYDVSALQLFQADQVRGYGTREGRRSLARPMHDEAAAPYLEGDAPSSAKIASDGSVATFVPARRAMTWQLTGEGETPVVRERNWVSFAPGEVRVCASCHGVNTADQAGQGEPQNPPEALRSLVRAWKADQGG